MRISRLTLCGSAPIPFVGYTAVTERVLENKVARSFARDLLQVPIDVATWLSNPRWPSKLNMLREMQMTYPDVFDDEEEVIACMPREEFYGVLDRASQGRATDEDKDKIFRHYADMSVLLLQRDGDGYDVDSGARRPGNGSDAGGKKKLRSGGLSMRRREPTIRE